MPRAPGFTKHPRYRVELDPNPNKVRVAFNGATVAETTRSLRVRETAHEPVVYVPRADVRMQHLEETDHHTFCPFKGEASYWTLRVGDREAENAVWSYEDPFDEVLGLKDYVAFYRDRVEVFVEA